MEQIPDGLHELLKDILIRDNLYMGNTLLCLQWLLYAQRPLSREELYFAILAGIEPSSASLAEWTATNVNEEDVSRFVLDSSKGLAELTKSKRPTVQFIHESVRDFLRDKGLAKLNVGSVSLGSSHDTLKNCCLNYVKIELSSVPLPDTLPPLNLLRLRASYRRRPNYTHFLNILCNVLSARFPLSSWIMKNNLFEKHEIRRYTLAAQEMYILAEKDYEMLLEAEIKLHHYVTARTERYGSPQMAAIMHGCGEAVRMLLTMDADTKDILNQRNSSGRPKLSMASQRNDAEMIKLLLDHGAIVDLEGANGRTPLSYAATSGNEAIVKLLLDSGANVDKNVLIIAHRFPMLQKSWHNQAALAVLLDRAADLEARDINNCTALSYAIKLSQDDVVKQLLNQGAEAESRDKHGSTPLCQAVRLQYPLAARLLLDKGANLESRDDDGRAALSYAVEYGYTILAARRFPMQQGV
ncbi:hypothetical protein BBP40_006677 [Aspergillus hancockii]|nr:hypothetical protein BBP40_006677 [Aspergillus hancockii]